MKHFLLFYDLSDDYLERRAQFRDEHLRKAWAANANGDLLLGGALSDPADTAILMFRGETSVVAEQFAETDPYVLNGLVKQWRVRQWTTVLGEWAATPVRPAS
ncbi:MAG: YciI-like protein [Acidobacteriota bacterium]